MATVEVIWKEPPADRMVGRGIEKVRYVNALKQHPGRWSLAQEKLKSKTATNVWKKLGCESVAAYNENDDKLFDIYVRWPEPEVLESAPQVPQSAPVAAPRPKTVDEVPAKALKPPAPAKPASVKPAKATLPITTKAPEEAPRLDPDDPQDAYLLRLRERQEAERAARLARRKA